MEIQLFWFTTFLPLKRLLSYRWPPVTPWWDRLPEGIHDDGHLGGAVGHGQHRGVLRPRRTADGLARGPYMTWWNYRLYDYSPTAPNTETETVFGIV